jgi:hypothetical protein
MPPPSAAERGYGWRTKLRKAIIAAIVCRSAFEQISVGCRFLEMTPVVGARRAA